MLSGAFRVLDKRFSFVGYLAAIVPAIILPYYSVIGGWVTKYLVAFIDGNAMNTTHDDYFTGFISSTAEPLIWFLVFIGITAVVVMCGVEKGVENVSKFMMPILVVLSVVIAIYAMFMPGAMGRACATTCCPISANSRLPRCLPQWDSCSIPCRLPWVL